MHNGDNMTRYPDHGPSKQVLIASIAVALQRLSMGELLIWSPGWARPASRPPVRSQASTMTSNPPQIIRLPSNGMVSGL